MPTALYFALGSLAAAFAMYRFLIRPALVQEERDKLVKALVDASPPSATDACAVVARAGRPVSYGCGHVDTRHFAHDFYGEICDADVAAIKKFDQCGDCLLATALKDSCRCAVCGYVILAGEPVAVVGRILGRPPAWATQVGENRFMACMRTVCCPTGAFFAGHWTEEGYRPLPHGMSIAGLVFATGEPVAADIGSTPSTPRKA